MARNIRVARRRRAWGWGIFLILIAALVLANQFGGFVQLSLWSVLVTALALAVFVECVVKLDFATLPVPLAALYYILQRPFDLPIISFWPLILVTALATAGLHVLLPRGLRRKKYLNVHFGDSNGGYRGGNIDHERIVENGENSNNPSISVQFGGISRYLHSDCLESADLDCSFGSLEVYFDHVQLSPNGAEVYINCKCGSIELYVPSHWRVVENVRTSLGSTEVDRRLRSNDPNAPQLTIHGNGSLGSAEVHRIKGMPE